MKKILFFFLILPLSCNHIYIASAQKRSAEGVQQRINDAFDHLRRSRDSTEMLITDIKNLARQKVVYRTKLVLRTDTVWRVDTCITYITPIDSLNIALIFQNRTQRKPTKVGKIIRYIFHPKTRTIEPVADSVLKR